MRWSRAYVDLMLCFARRAVELGCIAVDEALLDWTPLYLNFGLDRSFDPAEPAWQCFLTGYHAAADCVEWTYSFYLAHAREYWPSPYGCFSYHYEAESRTVRFHFGNRDPSGEGPLSRAERETRRQELRAMFADIRREVPEAQFVRGRSWMYNLPSYQRLFPSEYLGTAARVEPEPQFMSLWGQFLDHTWNVRSDRADVFLQRIAAASTIEQLRCSFPMPVLALRAVIAHFYTYYAVQ